ncbi:MAG: hypothetical protein PUC77_02410 [Bacteroidales bacterium]|nr:hypothetical protein [Bacteroidales bacterium]MDD6622369.1 hypothetical protein [Bacteroidales bacterium]
MKRIILATLVGATLFACSGSADKQSTQPAAEPATQAADADIYEVGYEEPADTVQSTSFETDDAPAAAEKPTTTVRSAAEEKIRKEIQEAGGEKRKLIEKEIKPMER